MNLERYRKSYEELEAIQQTKNLDFYATPAKYYQPPFRIAGNLYYTVCWSLTAAFPAPPT